MGQRTVVELVDDLDHHVLNGDGQTLRFGWQGVEYEIDLGAGNTQRLCDALAPFIAAGRRLNRTTTGSATEPAKRTDRAQLMRQWAAEHGLSVSSRGRVPKSVQDAYRAAH